MEFQFVERAQGQGEHQQAEERGVPGMAGGGKSEHGEGDQMGVRGVPAFPGMGSEGDETEKDQCPVRPLKKVAKARFAPFQQVAAGMPWEQVPPSLQILFLTTFHLSGINLIGFALALFVVILGPFRHGEGWADWALLGTVSLIALIAAYLLYDIAAQTGAAFPWFGPLISVAFVVGGFFLSTNRKARA